MTGACPALDEERVLAFVAGELPIEVRRSVEEHVDECESCRAVLAALVRDDRPSASTDWKPGCRVGRYVVRERIGRGGMGSVFRAEDLELHRPVALKRLHAEDEQARARLLLEARAAAQLQHPNVVAVYEVSDHEGAPFIAMELVDGTTLTSWLRAAPRSWREVVAVLAQAARGLAAAHARGLVHRDFKPDNVMVDTSGRARVADFGLARVTHDVEGSSAAPSSQLSHTTTTGAVVGTPAYLAPELVAGERPSARSDQYAFGVTAFQSLHGRYPFAGETAAEVWTEMAAGRVRDVDDRVPTWLDRRVRRAFAVDPGARWPDLAALAFALEQRPRRRGLIAIALAAVAIVAGFAIVHQPNELCTGSKTEVAAIWSGLAKARARAAFAATGLPAADQVWALVDEQLGRYGDDWSLMHQEVCEATRRRGEQSEQVMDLRMTCLAQRLHELRAAAETLSRADNQVVSNATEIAASLSPVSGCADVAALQSSMPVPDAMMRAVVADVRDRLARVKILYVSMNYQDALPAAEDALSRARTTHHQPVIAEALLQLGAIHVAHQDQAAEATLEEAFLTAEACGSDSVAVRAAASLAKELTNLARRPEAARWLRIARAALARRGGEREAAAVADTAASLYDGDGHYDEALAEYRREVAIREKSPDRDDEALATAHGRIGMVLVSQGHPDAALDEFRLAIKIVEATLGPENPVIETQHRNIGAVLDAQGKYDGALVEYRRALATDERILGPKHRDVATLHSNIGGVLLREGHHDQALAEYRQALAIQNEVLGPNHPELAITHDNIGKALADAGKPEQGLAELQQALAIQEAAGMKEHADAGQIHINLGTILRMVHRYDEAIAHYRAGLAVLIKALGPDHPHVAIAYMSIGTVLIEQGKLDQGLVEQRRALAIQTRTLGSEHPEVATTRTNIGVTLAMQGKLDEAVVEWTAVLAVRIKRLGPDSPATAGTMAYLGKAYLALHRYGNAVDNLRGALAILAAKSQGSPGEQLAEIRFDLAQALWDENKDRAEAIAEARKARDEYAKHPNATQELAGVDEWLAAHDRGAKYRAPASAIPASAPNRPGSR